MVPSPSLYDAALESADPRRMGCSRTALRYLYSSAVVVFPADPVQAAPWVVDCPLTAHSAMTHHYRRTDGACASAWCLLAASLFPLAADPVACPSRRTHYISQRVKSNSRDWKGVAHRTVFDHGKAGHPLLSVGSTCLEMSALGASASTDAASLAVRCRNWTSDRPMARVAFPVERDPIPLSVLPLRLHAIISRLSL